MPLPRCYSLWLTILSLLSVLHAAPFGNVASNLVFYFSDNFENGHSIAYRTNDGQFFSEHSLIVPSTGTRVVFRSYEYTDDDGQTHKYSYVSDGNRYRVRKIYPVTSADVVATGPAEPYSTPGSSGPRAPYYKKPYPGPPGEFFPSSGIPPLPPLPPIPPPPTPLPSFGPVGSYRPGFDSASGPQFASAPADVPSFPEHAPTKPSSETGILSTKLLCSALGACITD